MEKIIGIVFLVHCIILNIYCQSGIKVKYKYGVYGYDDNKEVPDILRKTHTQALLFEYELICDKNSSIFRMIDDINIIDEFVFRSAKLGAYGFSVFYSNNLKREKIKQTKYEGEEIVNVVIPYEKLKWEISKETKIIAGYKCNKAFCNVQYFSKVRNKMMSFNPVVWFSPEIPYPYGPIGLDGLPGLVLEATYNGKRYFYATQIQTNIKLNPKNLQLKESNKTYTEEEYENIVASKSSIPRN